MDIQQLDGDLQGEAVLVARWFVADAEGEQLLEARKSVYRQALSEPTHADLIRAQSQMVGNLSNEIAAAIKGLVP